MGPGEMPAGARLGRYQILRHLADGGMAELLLARTTGIEGFERHVVIKRIHADQARDQQYVQMFLDEARLAASLHHHNVVQVHDVGQQGGEYFFAMEYVHGEDLRRLLTRLNEKGEQMPLEHVVTIVAAAAAGLHHAHEMKGPDRKPLNIVHRDVSPANVLVSYDGNVKVVDFGIAKAAMRSAETRSGTLKGKVAYMSPEQCMGAEVDRRADVFALGIVLWELATVRRLFKGPSDFVTMASIVSGRVPKPTEHRKDLPKPFEQIILKALAPKAADRYQSADELRLALEAYATRAALRTSTNALGDWMIKTFGQKPEPWLVESDEPVIEMLDVDFDGSASGVFSDIDPATIPIPEQVFDAKSSPLMRARGRAKETGAPVFATPVPGKIRAVSEPSTVQHPEPREIHDESGWGAPGHMPTTASGTPMAWAPDAKLPEAPVRNRRPLLIAAVAVPVVAAGVIVVMMMGGSGDSPKAAAPPPAKIEMATPPPAPAPPPPPPKVETPPPVPVVAAGSGSGSGSASAEKPKQIIKPKQILKPKQDPNKPKPNWDPNALFPH